jgi:hypothetical protein
MRTTRKKLVLSTAVLYNMYVLSLALLTDLTHKKFKASQKYLLFIIKDLENALQAKTFSLSMYTAAIFLILVDLMIGDVQKINIGQAYL